MRIKMNSYFSQGMILKCHEENWILGEDKPFQLIMLELCKEGIPITRTLTESDSEGGWKIAIPPQNPGGPYEIRISGEDTEKISDVYFGQVFLLAGQSNMELPLNRVMDLYEKEIMKDIEEGKTACIRQFTINKTPEFEEQEDHELLGKWVEVSKEGLDELSAVGYFFAKKYQDFHSQVPIGLIQSALGGSPIEAWCSREIIEEVCPELLDELEVYKNPDWLANKLEEERKATEKWLAPLLADKSPADFIRRKDMQSDLNWKTIDLPTTYKGIDDLENFSGCLWLRKDIHISQEDLDKLSDQVNILRLGAIVDKDDVWINNHWIGGTEYRYPPRKYSVSNDLLRIGKNRIYIRHIVDQGQGEFVAGKDYFLELTNKSYKEYMDISGKWEYMIDKPMEPRPDTTFFTWKATALYYGVVKKIAQLNLSGVIWYQGESNVMMEDQSLYPKLFSLMVKEIRRLFQKPELPVITTLLAGFGPEEPFPGQIGYFRLRQMEIIDGGLKQIGLVSAQDLGEYNDIHPLRKKALGSRMALTMERLQKGRASTSLGFVYEGPYLDKIVERDKSWILMFGGNQNPLQMEGQSCFLLRKKSGWEWVTGQLLNNRMIQIMKPFTHEHILSIAYGLEDYPYRGMIINSKGIPLLPFVWELD